MPLRASLAPGVDYRRREVDTVEGEDGDVEEGQQDRAGIVRVEKLLRRHGNRLIGVTNKDLVDLALSVAAHRTGVEELGVWFEEHTETV
jgi:hypothetical protein